MYAFYKWSYLIWSNSKPYYGHTVNWVWLCLKADCVRGVSAVGGGRLEPVDNHNSSLFFVPWRCRHSGPCWPGSASPRPSPPYALTANRGSWCPSLLSSSATPPRLVSHPARVSREPAQDSCVRCKTKLASRDMSVVASLKRLHGPWKKSNSTLLSKKRMKV